MRARDACACERLCARCARVRAAARWVAAALPDLVIDGVACDWAVAAAIELGRDHVTPDLVRALRDWQIRRVCTRLGCDPADLGVKIGDAPAATRRPAASAPEKPTSGAAGTET